MSMLDAHIPQLVASQSAFAAKAGLMRSTIGQDEQEAMSAQAFHAGESAASFQAAMHRWKTSGGAGIAVTRGGVALNAWKQPWPGHHNVAYNEQSFRRRLAWPTSNAICCSC